MKWLSGLLAFAAAAAIYGFTNRFIFFEPRLLPLTWIDLAIPLLPGTIWLYLSAFLFLPVTFHLTTAPKRRNILLFLGIVGLSAIFFVLFPIRFPRELYPLLPDSAPLTLSVFEWLRQVDAPVNCFPSLHASVVTFSLINFKASNEFHGGWRKRGLIMGLELWATLVIISTLTTKQHYWVDTAAGVLLGYAAFKLGCLIYVPKPNHGSTSKPEASTL